MAFKARKKDLRRVEAGNGIERSQSAHDVPTQGWTGPYISEVHMSISLFVCSFPGGVWNPVERKDCYQSCKMVYYPVSNCTWKGTSNLYEKCLRLPAHSVIHARSVPVMPENKRRCTSLGKRHLIRLKSSWREALKCHFLKWTGHYHLKSWGLWDWGGGKEFFFWFNRAPKS